MHRFRDSARFRALALRPVLALGALLLGGLLGACGEQKFTIAYANEEPYGYLDTQTGEVTGEAPEIARVILARMGIDDYEMEVTEFGQLISGLKAGRFDMVAAGMYVTPERAREIAFSRPTYVMKEGLLVRKGNPLGLHSYEDISSHETAKIGVMSGAVEKGFAEAAGVPDDRIDVFRDYPSAMGALRNGQIDALGLTNRTAEVQLRKDDSGEIVAAEPFEQPVIDGVVQVNYGAFGFRKEDDELRDRFNRELEKFIGTEEHLEILRRFGFTEANLPGDISVEEIAGVR